MRGFPPNRRKVQTRVPRLPPTGTFRHGAMLGRNPRRGADLGQKPINPLPARCTRIRHGRAYQVQDKTFAAVLTRQLRSNEAQGCAESSHSRHGGLLDKSVSTGFALAKPGAQCRCSGRAKRAWTSEGPDRSWTGDPSSPGRSIERFCDISADSFAPVLDRVLQSAGRLGINGLACFAASVVASLSSVAAFPG